MARPVIEIKKEQFESLCSLQCTLDEIAGFCYNIKGDCCVR